MSYRYPTSWVFSTLLSPLFAAVLGTACAEPAPARFQERPTAGAGPCVQATDAADAAIAFLRSQPFASRYHHDGARTKDKGKNWIVKFQRVEEPGVDSKPSEGWIRVAKRDCSATWLPLK